VALELLQARAPGPAPPTQQTIGSRAQKRESQLMTEQLPGEASPPSAAFDWAAARGQKWCDSLVGMEAMLSPIDEPLIDALELDAPYRIADLGCGGGGTSLSVLRRAPTGSVVHGFDISPALIESARARVPTNADALAFALADVATAPKPKLPYQRLISRFGVMFYDDPPAAFARLCDWLEPGGRFAFAVWGPPVDNAWTSILRDLASEAIELPQPDPEAPGPYRYARAEKLFELLDAAGFAELELVDWRGALQVGGGLSAPEAADFALRSFSIGEQISAAGSGAYERVRRALSERFAEQEENGRVRLAARVHIVKGERSNPR
jgi:SAM-dependent methyltransferase